MSRISFTKIVAENENEFPTKLELFSVLTLFNITIHLIIS